MTPLDHDKLFRMAVLVYGERAQIDQAIEECAELIVALNHHRRGRGTREEVAGEIADVFIMMRQMAFMVGEDLCEQRYQEKYDRLRDKLDGKFSLGAKHHHHDDCFAGPCTCSSPEGPDCYKLECYQRLGQSPPATDPRERF